MIQKNLFQNQSKIKKQIGEESAICALSGGVDSFVAATLVAKAIPNLQAVYVDNGLMRKTKLKRFKKQLKVQESN